MHDAIAEAAVVVGESSTMASEAAVLGVPSVFIHPIIERGYTQEQADRWRIVHWYIADQYEEAIACAEMLMAQARSLWPDCPVLAVLPDRSMRSAAIFGMGQWTPDHLLTGPVDGEGIVVGLRDLGRTAQGRRTREADEGDRRQASDIPGDVILRCRQALQARWSVKPA